jgi:hypothetical protein
MAYLRARRSIKVAPGFKALSRSPLRAIGATWMFGACLLAVFGGGASARTWHANRQASRAPVYSVASNSVVQLQPARGSCRAIGSGQFSRPDPRCTPGALNPAVRQDNINQTICRAGWTRTVRPPEYVTEREKRLSMVAYSDRSAISDYEYDHFVPLELGGATNDPRNLWPEPGASPNPKDMVENYLNREVCDQKMTLAHAQREIAADWIVIYRQLHRKPTRPASRPAPQPPTPPSSAAATCSANAQWSGEYGDYDVYVSSNQRDTKVTVTGAGTSASWYTDSSGSAGVYFHAGRSAAGDQVTVRVGAATCYAIL